MCTPSPKHLLSLPDWTPDEVLSVIDLGLQIKAAPQAYANKLVQQTMLMVFAKPSLRTRVSFETGMTQLGGHAIYYDTSTSPMGGAGKETVADTAATASRMVQIVMARLFEHETIVDFAMHSSVPVINALTNFSHPCQILADLMTIKEKKGTLKGLTLLYTGDCNNNVTHSLLYGCSMAGMNIRIAFPRDTTEGVDTPGVGLSSGGEFEPHIDVVETAREYAKQHGTEVVLTHDAKAAADGVDVVYTDSWMSYHIPKEGQQRRVAALMPFQVDEALMACAKPDAIFMNCLPAMRGMEQTAEVIDGPQSVVFDEAENRLHVQKGVVLHLLGQD